MSQQRPLAYCQRTLLESCSCCDERQCLSIGARVSLVTVGNSLCRVE